MNKTSDISISNIIDEELNSQPISMIENGIENNFSITLSRTLAKQLHNMAKYEGICATDLILELLTEGIARRITEDQIKPAPSHLMTRNGYVQDQQNAQPSMSHHAFHPNGNVRDGQNNRNKNNFQRHQTPPARSQNNERYNNRNSSNNYANSGTYFKPNKKSEF